MKIKPFFKWYDLWIGMFIDTKKKAIYIIPFPMFGIKIDYRTLEERNTDLIWKIMQHQSNGLVHPLTCGNSSDHFNLVPDENDEEKVILKCMKCDYIQDVPSYFLKD